MKPETVTKIIKYAVTAALGGLIAWGVLALRDYTGAEPPAEKYRMLCDAFTFPGVLLMLSAALVALSNEGAFLGLGYVFGVALKGLIGLGGRQERYADYVERKTEKGRAKGYGFMFFVGLGYFLLAILFLVLFYIHFEG